MLDNSILQAIAPLTEAGVEKDKKKKIEIWKCVSHAHIPKEKLDKRRKKKSEDEPKPNA